VRQQDQCSSTLLGIWARQSWQGAHAKPLVSLVAALLLQQQLLQQLLASLTAVLADVDQTVGLSAVALRQELHV